MDPVSAISLVGNCLQFIDTGTRFTTLAFRLYRHASDDTDEYSAMLKIIEDLNSVLPRLKTSTTNSGSNGEEGTAKLAVDCSNAATKLAVLLSKIKPPNKYRKRDAFRAAFLAMYKEDEIATLHTQLASFRDQLNLHLLLHLRDFSTTSAAQQGETLRQLGVVQNDNNELKGIAASILERLVSNGVPRDDRVIDASTLRQDLVSTIYSKNQLNSSNLTVKNIQLSADQIQRAQQVFLSTLQYDSIIDRENRIVIAHEATFQWVFKDVEAQTDDARSPEWSNLKAWLESADQLYWITGKAGSGKSTLMKYLCSPVSQIEQQTAYTSNDDLTLSHERTRTSASNQAAGTAFTVSSVDRDSRCKPYLKRWAGDAPLILSSFYFWNSGHEIQATQKGLLRTILCQILEQRSDLITAVAAQDWEAACLFDSCRIDWSAEELHEKLKTAIDCLRSDSKICFFIDGLDEFDDNHTKLISMIEDIISGNHHVKVCVASRPWEVFQIAFERKPSLRLEDLTFDDIKKFVFKRFTADSDFGDLQQRYPSFADTLINNIVSKASGVFLWVDLVVTSLLSGMRFGDRIQDFQRRLDELPPDLENLYDKILHSLDPFYLAHAAQYFSLIEAAFAPPTILEFSFADEETPESAIRMPVDSLSRQNILLRVNAATKRLNSRCKGLLEIDRGLDCRSDTSLTHRRHNVTVQYLHRTVRDYIVSEKARDFLRPLVDPDFDPSVQLVCGILMQVKADCHLRLDLASLLSNCFRQAATVAKSNAADIVKLLYQFEQVIVKPNLHEFYKSIAATAFALPAHCSLPSYRNIPYRSYETFIRSMNDDSIATALLIIGTQSSTISYVRAKMPKNGLLRLSNTSAVGSSHNALTRKTRFESLSSMMNRTSLRICPLLAFALLSPWPDPDMVRSLLESGADPNFKMEDPLLDSPWVMALDLTETQLIQAQGRHQEVERWKEILKLLYAAGGHNVRVSESALPDVTIQRLDEVRRESISPVLSQKLSRLFHRKKQLKTHEDSPNNFYFAYPESVFQNVAR